MLACTFALKKNNQFYPEEIVGPAIAKGDPMWIDSIPWSGKVIMADEYSSVWVEDELEALIYNMCGRTLSEALDSGEGNYPYFEMYGNVKLEVEEEFLSISGDFIQGKPIFTFEEAAVALYECGLRFVRMLKSHPALVEQLNKNIRMLEDAMDKTRKRLVDKRFLPR